MKRMLALLTVLLFCLPCAAQAQEAARGRYVQEIVTLPQGVSRVFAMDLDPEGRIRVLAQRDQTLIRASLDGVQWREKDVPWLGQLPSVGQVGDLQAAAMAGEDVCLGLNLPLSEGGLSYQVLWAKDGRPTIVDDAQMHSDLPYLWRLYAAEDLVIIQDVRSGAYAYDSQTGERLAGYPQVSGVMQADKSCLYALNAENQSAQVLDLASGEVLSEMNDAPLGEDNAAFCDGQSFYLLNKGGIYRIAVGGSVWEQLVDGTLTELGQSATRVRGLLLADQDFYALMNVDGQGRLLRFRYDADIDTVPAKTLTVCALHPSLIIQQAAGAFQAAYPQYRIRLITLLDEGGGTTSQDVIKALNVELLSGSGPDVLLLDGLPVDAYIDKGVLADLSDVVNPMLQGGELMNNLIAPFYTANAIYQVPTRAALPVILGETGAATWDQLVAAAIGGLRLPPRSPLGYLEMFLPVCYNAWFSADGALKEGELTAFLTGVRALCEAVEPENAIYAEVADGYAQYVREVFIAEGRALVPMNGFLCTQEELTGMKAGRLDALITVIQGFAVSDLELTAIEDAGKAISALPGQAGGVCIAAGRLGVNARSPEKRAAMAFVGTMLSQAVQDVDLYDSAIPVNRRSFEKMLERENEDMGINRFTDMVTGEPVTLVGRWPSRATRQKVYDLMMGADAVYAPDEELLTLIREGLAPFCRGEMDSQAAAQAVSARLRAYLAE